MNFIYLSKIAKIYGVIRLLKYQGDKQKLKIKNLEIIFSSLQADLF